MIEIISSIVLAVIVIAALFWLFKTTKKDTIDSKKSMEDFHRTMDKIDGELKELKKYRDKEARKRDLQYSKEHPCITCKYKFIKSNPDNPKDYVCKHPDSYVDQINVITGIEAGYFNSCGDRRSGFISGCENGKQWEPIE